VVVANLVPFLRVRMAGRDVRLRRSGGKALLCVACPTGTQARGARRNGNKAAIDRQESGRSIEGRRPWTYR